MHVHICRAILLDTVSCCSHMMRTIFTNYFDTPSKYLSARRTSTYGHLTNTLTLGAVVDHNNNCIWPKQPFGLMSCCSHMRIFHLRWPPTFAVYFAGSLLSILAICTYFVVVATALCFRENTKFVHSSRHRYRAPVNCNCIGTGNLYEKLSLKIDFFF